MASGLSVRQRRRVLQLLERNWSQRRIAIEVGVARSTVQRLAAAALHGTLKLEHAKRCTCGALLIVARCVACEARNAPKPSKLCRALRPRVNQLGLRPRELAEYEAIRAEKIARGEMPASYELATQTAMQTDAIPDAKPSAKPPGGAHGSF